MADLDYSALRFWLDILQLLAVVGLFVYTAFTSRTKANKAAIDRIEGRLVEEIRRIDQATNAIANAPSHADLGKVYDRVNDVAGSVNTITGEMSAMRRTLDLMSQHMMGSGK